MICCGLEILLDLHGQILVQEDGSWIKIEARRAEETEQRPHGIKYSLTLHARDGKRLMGYDNAHGLKQTGKRHEAQKVPFDHRHPFEKREPVIYAISSPEELLRHFFAEVDEVLRELKKR